ARESRSRGQARGADGCGGAGTGGVRGAMNETIHAHASSAMVRALAEIAYDAGRIVLKHYTDEIVSRRKEDHSPVTAADEEAEKFILARLAHLAPDVPVIAEEEA